MLEKTYQPNEVEERHYKAWEESGAFECASSAVAAGRPARDNADPYTIVIPPPNVTGSLHMGHALNNTLQDILIRYQRMRGRDSLWQPGTDHAGIATQMVVERQLAEAGETRHDYGREKFIEKVWKWKAESGGTITGQLRRLGASCDWSRERFTMDEGLSAAVRKVFVDLHKQGLIYRDKRLVNWDPKLHTAISDLEVEQRETTGKLWYFKYPIEDREGEFLTVATTRPETMLGDVAVAVHPEDDRYKDLVGKNCILPIVGRQLIIVADDYADPEKGSGAVKMTPAHDFNDFEVGRRHNLKLVNIFNEDACLNDNVPDHYKGLDRFKARDKVVAEMESLGLLDKIEDNEMTVPYGDRSGVVIEPWLMDQWFVDAQRLAGPAITAVEQGETKFVPQQWENTYYEWMRNIQPWCISRQIWWGHQIPAWFGPDGEIFVELNAEEAHAAARDLYGKDVELHQDPDVLDTWFSSALWPFSTLGWPDETPEVARYYQTDVLITGFDIIFFWVARMMMMGIHFMDEVPFHTVYIHALVRDEDGQKMSKSKGNVIDPLALIDKFGADALRFTLTAFAAQGRDVRLSEQRVEGYRNFCTKIWNAARFCEMNGCAVDPAFDPSLVKETVNKWIIGKVIEAERAISTAINDFKFNEAAQAAYQFAWGTYCDWYLEFTKPILQDGDDAAAKAETHAAAAWAFDQILHLLHPIMPFITEELWEQTAESRETMLIASDWPELPDTLIDADANAEMDWMVRLISEIRSVRSEMNVPPKAEVPIRVANAGDVAMATISKHAELIKRVARVEAVTALEVSDIETAAKGAIQFVLDEATVLVGIADFIDLDAEKARLDKALAKQHDEITRFKKKLANEKFVANAPDAVVETEREKLADARLGMTKLEEARARLMSAG
ncbi:MAG: valine--tRNA ligase [Rhodospirillaceae bacterium]|nr:valine--tRNA ligase [Rhodospirillaceae bacterium]